MLKAARWYLYEYNEKKKTLIPEEGIRAQNLGAGLTFKQNGLHFLNGILSVNIDNVEDPVTIFTDVSHYTQWICNIYTSHTNITGKWQYSTNYELHF